MNIQVIAEHSVDLDILPEKATILDLGCRDFQFTNHFRALGHTVHAVDIDQIEGGDYDQCAITDYTGRCGIQYFADAQATQIGKGSTHRCYTLKDYSELKGVDFWDLIKMDVEGEETKIILNLKKAPAKQISIEFHLHLNQTTMETTDIYLKLVSLGYKVGKHSITSEHGAGPNFWDSLFLLK